MLIAPVNDTLEFGMIVWSHGDHHVAYRTGPGVSSPALSAVRNADPGLVSM